MNLAALQQAVSDALTGTTFRLDGSTLSPPVQALFAKLLGQPVLELSAASVDASSSEPTATGTLASAPAAPFGLLAGLGATARFRLDGDGTAQVALGFAPPAAQHPGWGIGNAIPALANSVLGVLTWSKAEVGFDSGAPAELPASFPATYGLPQNAADTVAAMTKGMAFAGEVSYAGQDPGLKLLLGSETVPVAGPVEWHGAVPRMDLASGTVTTLSFGGFELPIDVHLVAAIPPSVLAPASGGGPAPTPACVALLVLHGTLERPAGAQKLQIPFYVEVYDERLHQVAVVGQFAEASALGLSEVAQLLGAKDLSSQQASGFPTLAGLALQQVQIVADLPTQTLTTASATVGFTPPGGPWKPFGDLFAFDGMSVTFTLVGPLSSPTIETIVDAEVTLAGGTLDGELQLPELAFSCTLAEDRPPIDLTQILATIVGDAFGDFKVLCTQLTVLGDYGAGLYRFQATVHDDPPWTFTLGSSSFGLTSIGFDLTHAQGQTTGQVVAQLIVASTPVQISADYEGATAGWTFTGGTMGPQSISLTDLVDDALEMFGFAKPSFVPEVTITGLQMMVATASFDFGFSVTGTIEMAGTTVGIEIDVGRTHDQPAPAAATITFRGYLTIGTATFEADFTLAPGSTGVLFEWTDTEQPLELGDIASFFGLPQPQVPGNLDLALTKAELFYDFTKGTLAVSATSAHYGTVTLLSFKQAPAQGGARLTVLLVDVPLGLNLQQLPVAGDLLPSQPALEVKDILAILALGGEPAAADVTQANALLASLGLPPLPAPTLAGGATFGLKVALGADATTIVLPLSSQQQQPQLTAGGGAAPSGPPAPGGQPAPGGLPAPGAAPPPPPAYQAGAKWITLDKSFGPVRFERIGVLYQDGVLFLLFDASLSFSSLEIGFDGLGIGSALTKPDFHGHLDGLSISLVAGPVKVSGGLLVVPPDSLPEGVAYEFLGEVTIGFGDVLIMGVGAYAKVSGHPAFFLFAELDAELGGPPAFFVTGLMGGLGYNYSLTLPAPDAVASFPFVAGIGDSSVLGPSPTPDQVLQLLAGAGGKPAWIAPRVGTYWGAAGVVFRSFELILGRALLVLEVSGGDVEIALLGLASMSLPQGSTDGYAYVELQLEAVLEPQAGYFGVIASLTPNSYVLTKACHLTGGFAFCVWFGPSKHAGDFVLTVGGYHPAFGKPDWYPAVAPVGFNWQVDSSIAVKGGAYFALTPSAAMAGGNLQATYQSGDLKAWFDAWANVLVRWKPFHFEASIGISIGASYRLNLLFTKVTISVELGASLVLWGPPTGGTVTVHWTIISFTIGFGASRSDGPSTTLDWGGFSTLLPNGAAPAPHQALSAMAAGPQLAAAPPPAPLVIGVDVNGGMTGQSDGTWVVRADELVFTTRSAVPASSVTLAGSPAPGGTAAHISIRPMDLDGVTSVHDVSLQNLDDPTDVPDLSRWSPRVQATGLPGALWGAALHGADPPASADTVTGQTGVQLTAPPAALEGALGSVDMSELTEPLPQGPQALAPAAQASAIPAPAVDSGSIGKIAQAFSQAGVGATQTAQTAVLGALASFDASPPTHELTSALGAQAGSAFAEAPLVVSA